MSKRPSPDDMRLAAEWLTENEGDKGEAESCAVTATWLREQADALEFRQACKEAAVTVRSARAALARQAKS